MSDSTPKETFMKLFTAFAMHDDAAARALIADDAVWQFPGRDGQLAGDHIGVDAIIGFLHKVRDLTGGTFAMAPEQVIAEDDMVVVLFTGSGERQGKTLSNPTCLVMKFKDGQMQHAREFVWDVRSVDNFWG